MIQKSNINININKCIVELVGGNKKHACPNPGANHGRFRLWPFKSNCAKSPLDKAWCGFWFPPYFILFDSTFLFDQRTSPKDLFLRVLSCPLKIIMCSVLGSWKSNGLSCLEVLWTRFSGQSTRQVCKSGPQNRAEGRVRGQRIMSWSFVWLFMRFGFLCVLFVLLNNILWYTYYTTEWHHMIWQEESSLVVAAADTEAPSEASWSEGDGFPPSRLHTALASQWATSAQSQSPACSFVFALLTADRSKPSVAMGRAQSSATIVYFEGRFLA